MRKAVIIILALVVALGTLPVTFACYNGGWGNWNWFWKPQQPVYCCPTYCNLNFFSVDASDNEDVKDVADTNACITGCGKTITITIDNAYPGYEGIIDFCVKNTGTLAATITGITIDNPNAGYLQLDLTGAVQVGTVVSPCSPKCGQLVVYGIPQLEDAENRTFTFDITIDYSCTCVPQNCETAYAYGCSYCHCYATCFSHWGFSQWGWTNGQLGPGCYTFDIYAGAAQCNISKGKKVGYLTISYNGSTAVVTYHMYSGYKMDETHLYVGCNPLPSKNGSDTVAPGQYPYSHDLSNASTDTYTVTGLSGKIYIIAHAVVCGNSGYGGFGGYGDGGGYGGCGGCGGR
jgi:hypothetical protein